MIRMTNILPFQYSAPLPVTALEVTIARANTAHGERFTVCAKDDKGNWQPLIKDPKFGRAIPYLTRDFAMRGYKHWKAKADKQSVLVCFVEEI